jgi:hypothetical protein
MFVGTEGNDEPHIPFYVRDEGKYALQYKPSFFELDTVNYYSVEVDRKIRDPKRKLLEPGRILNYKLKYLTITPFNWNFHLSF